jgi:glycine oxidase
VSLSAQPGAVPTSVPPGRTYDAVVVGAGVIGLSCAWRLAQRTLSVLVVDPEPARGASWMAAGMLAPVSEAQFGEESHVAPALASAARWPNFAAELSAAADAPLGYLRSGTLIVAADEDDRDWAHELYRFQVALGLEAHWLTSRAARHQEPTLSPGVRAAIAVPGDHQVDNRLLLGALLSACHAAAVTVVRRRVVAVECAGGAVRGVALDDGSVAPTSVVVVAAGCHSPALGGLPDGTVPTVRPVKGQILRLAPTPRAPRLSTVVRAVVQGSSVYLVPRADGSVVVGATVEERGFDCAVTAGAVYELLRDAHRVVPGVDEMELAESTAGLRPGSPDNAPVVGRPPVHGADGLVLATGHHRQGILLAPLTAEVVAALVTGTAVPDEAARFDPGRFAPDGAAEVRLAARGTG